MMENFLVTGQDEGRLPGAGRQAKASWVLVWCCRWLGEQMPAFLPGLSAGEGGCRRGSLESYSLTESSGP